MSLNWVLQPKDSNLCGQAAIAMLFNITLDKACELFGHRRQTWTRDMIRVLREAGWKVPDKRIVISARAQPPDPSLVNLKWKNRRRHWIVMWEGEVYCGLGYDKYFYKVAGELVKPVSFLPLTPP